MTWIWRLLTWWRTEPAFDLRARPDIWADERWPKTACPVGELLFLHPYQFPGLPTTQIHDQTWSWIQIKRKKLTRSRSHVGHGGCHFFHCLHHTQYLARSARFCVRSKRWPLIGCRLHKLILISCHLSIKWQGTWHTRRSLTAKRHQFQMCK